MFLKISIILVIILTILTLCNLYNSYNNSYENYDTPSDKKILNLVLFSKNTPEYIEMYKITRNFYKKYKNVVSIYYTYSDHDNYDKKENILYIKGKETYLPGILDKTVKTFQYVPIIEKMMNKKFDYIIRTNISTIVRFDKLSNKLNGVDYGCGLKNIIYKNYRDPNSGIIDDHLEGLEYASGTCIIFSRDLFYKILPKLYLVDRKLIDDVSIGKFMKKYFGKYKLVSFNDFFVFTDNKDLCQKDIENNIFFRNRHPDRKMDLEKMNKIIDNLSML